MTEYDIKPDPFYRRRGFTIALSVLAILLGTYELMSLLLQDMGL